MKRLNWSINWSDALFSPKPKSIEWYRHPGGRKFYPGGAPDTAETSATGDILFTIRIYMDPITALAREPDGALLMRNLAAQLEALTPEEAAYKGLTHRRAEFVELLIKSAENSGHPQPLP